jgi:hypothetical protein
MLPLLAALCVTQAPPAQQPVASGQQAPSVESVIPARPPPRKKRRGFPQRLLRPYDPGTPIVLSFDGAPVQWLQAGKTFEFEPGQPRRSAWPSAATPWLVRDLNHDGKIDSGRELFGSFTLLPDGTRAKNGFVALAALDDGDGVLDARDPAFGELMLWRDADGDRKVGPGELTPLSAAKVTRIELRYVDQPRCDASGGCERERARFFFDGEREGEAVDVHLVLLPLTSS